MLTMIGAISEFERTNMLERQEEGIRIAKREGKYNACGRKKKDISDSCESLIKRYASGEFTKTQLAAELKVFRPTLDRILKEYNAI